MVSTDLADITLLSVDCGDNGGNDAVHDEAATSTHKVPKSTHKYPLATTSTNKYSQAFQLLEYQMYCRGEAEA